MYVCMKHFSRILSGDVSGLCCAEGSLKDALMSHTEVLRESLPFLLMLSNRVSSTAYISIMFIISIMFQGKGAKPHEQSRIFQAGTVLELYLTA